MEQILVVMSQKSLCLKIREILAPEFDLILVDSAEKGGLVLSERRHELAAVLMELALAKDGGVSWLGSLKGITLLESIPLIGVLPSQSMQEDTTVTRQDFYDYVTPHDPAWLTVKRIRNAIQSRNSLSYSEMERMLRFLPANFILKDTERRYVFTTQKWRHFAHSDEPGWSIRGKTDLQARLDHENALMADASDRRILESGKGETYIIKEFEDGQEECLELVKNPIYDKDGHISGIIGLISNVTERHRLRMELERRSRTDALTELLNKQSCEEMMRQALKESCAKNVSCALLMIDVDRFKMINDRFGHAVGDAVLAAIGRAIRENTRCSDVSGRIGGDEFMMLLRDIPSPEIAVKTAERIGGKLGKR